MAQSIRISDALYQLALAHSAPMGRSLAQQVDYWARLGVALEEAGMTVQQALAVLAAPEKSGRGARHAPVEGAAAVRGSIERLSQEVAAGRRSAVSLFAIPERMARKAQVTFPSPELRANKGW